MVVRLGEAECGQESSKWLRGQLPSSARESSTDISAFYFVSFDWGRIIKSHKAWGIFRN